MVEASKEKPISKLIIGSHGSGSAIYMNPDAGLYGGTVDKYMNSALYDSHNPWYDRPWNLPNKDARTLDDIKEKMKEGKIKFSDGAEIYLLGCNTSNHTIPGVDGLAKHFQRLCQMHILLVQLTKVLQILKH